MPIEEMIKMLESNFWNDFTEAEKNGEEAITKLCDEKFNAHKTNVKLLTELVLVMNWKIWEWYESDIDMAKVYEKLRMDLDEWCCENLKGEDAKYYYRKTD